MAERRILKIPCLLPDGAATDASIICLKAPRRVRIGEENDAAWDALAIALLYPNRMDHANRWRTVVM